MQFYATATFQLVDTDLMSVSQSTLVSIVLFGISTYLVRRDQNTCYRRSLDEYNLGKGERASIFGEGSIDCAHVFLHEDDLKRMEKGHGMMMGGGSGMEDSIHPTAPPSYDQAMANTDAKPSSYLPPNAAPYPTQMPMPNPYGQPSVAMPMPMPAAQMPPQVHQYPTTPQYMPQQQVASQSYAPPQIQIIQQAVAYALGPNSVKMSCPTCRADIKTTTVSDHQPSAHICCIILCLLGCCLCSCLPYCMNSFMSVHHSCPNCKAYIGTWKG